VGQKGAGCFCYPSGTPVSGPHPCANLTTSRNKAPVKELSKQTYLPTLAVIREGEGWVRKFIITLVALWPLSGLQAAAAEAKLTHLAHLMAEAAVGENAPELTADFASGAVFGNLPLRFETTTLADIQRLKGGAGHALDEATQHVTWLCYTRHAEAKEPAETVWFISNANGAPVSLNMVVVQQVDAAKDDGCAIVAHDFVFPSFGVPSIGRTAAELKSHFGILPYDSVHNLYFNSTRPTSDGGGKSVYQRLAYAMSKSGLVIGIALGQTTNNN
jgi:hypothetical protein